MDCSFIVAISRCFQWSIRWNELSEIQCDDPWFGEMVRFLDRIQIDTKILFTADSMNETASTFMMIAVMMGMSNIGCCGIAGFMANLSPYYEAICCCPNKSVRREAMTLCTALLLMAVLLYRVIVFTVKMAVGIYIFNI